MITNVFNWPSVAIKYNDVRIFPEFSRPSSWKRNPNSDPINYTYLRAHIYIYTDTRTFTRNRKIHLLVKGTVWSEYPSGTNYDLGESAPELLFTAIIIAFGFRNGVSAAGFSPERLIETANDETNYSIRITMWANRTGRCFAVNCWNRVRRTYLQKSTVKRNEPFWKGPRATLFAVAYYRRNGGTDCGPGRDFRANITKVESEKNTARPGTRNCCFDRIRRRPNGTTRIASYYSVVSKKDSAIETRTIGIFVENPERFVPFAARLD